MRIPVKKIVARAYRIITFPARCVTAKIVQAPGLWQFLRLADRRVIMFLVPGREIIGGGPLSIFNLYRFSQEMAAVHHAKVVMCSYPGEGADSCRYPNIANDVTIYPFRMILAMCRRVEQMQLHVPEYAAQAIVERIGFERLARLRSTHGLRLNILNQNILLMPPDAFLQRLRLKVPEHLTCTTAHPSYSTVEFRRRWGMPVHHLPAWTYPDAAVLNKIATELPRLEIKVIEDMRFEDYLKLARAAKWSLTFGEGMDDYFMSVLFRGGVGFAVYNTEFFTPEFKGRRTVYPDWETLATRITADIKALDSKQAMESYNAEVRPLLAGIWSRDKTLAALEAFYRGQFTLP
jgi:hypothetical protein